MGSLEEGRSDSTHIILIAAETPRRKGVLFKALFWL